jgi:outer membrane murein-binding lipoprotein Lpp
MNESLLPTRTVLQGGEMLRVVGVDGKPMRLPLSALLDAAEARFATNAKEAAQNAGLWTAVNALSDDIKVLTARTLVLEARPVVSIAGLATQASVTALTSSVSTLTSSVSTLTSNVAALTTSVTALIARVTALESEIKLKKDK